MTAFLETRLLVVTADTAGRKMLPWRSRENYLTLKRCWDKLTVEEKQNRPGSVAAAASPAETQVTHAGCSGPSGPTGHAPEAAGWKVPKDTPLNEAPVRRAFSQGPLPAWLWACCHTGSQLPPDETPAPISPARTC